MPIPAVSPATVSVVFDSALIKTLVYTGGSSFTLELARYASANGLIQPGSSTGLLTVTDATANAALQSLIASFLTARNLTGTVDGLAIYGNIQGTTLRGSFKMILDGSPIIVPDVYAEAANDQSFAVLLTTFIAAIQTYNTTAGII